MCNVPTSVPKSHFDITSYKEQTVNKEKDTSIGKETNGKEALKLTFVGARKILNPIKQYLKTTSLMSQMMMDEMMRQLMMDEMMNSNHQT